MALNGLFCADVTTHSLTLSQQAAGGGTEPGSHYTSSQVSFATLSTFSVNTASLASSKPCQLLVVLRYL